MRKLNSNIYIYIYLKLNIISYKFFIFINLKLLIIYLWLYWFDHLFVGLFKDILTLAKSVWPHHPTPLRAPLKVSDTVVGDRSLVQTSDQWGHQRRDVHTDEDPTIPSMLCVCVCIYIYIYILHNMYKKKKRPNVLRRGNVQYIHENWIGSFLSKRILNSYPLVYTVQA